MKWIKLLVLIFLSFQLLAQDVKEQNVKTDVTSVIVYLDGAEITRKKEISLAKGRNLVVFENLSPKFINSSLRLSVPMEHESDISILAISGQIDYLSKADEQPRVRQIRDSIQPLKLQLDAFKDEQEAYKIEKDMILKNQKLGSQNDAVTITELQQAADFFRKRVHEINKQLTLIAQKSAEENKKLKQLERELKELNAQLSFERGKVNVLIASKKQIKTPIELKYRINEAGWSPVYDVKATELDKPVNLVYRALVYNDSRIDWKDVKVKLSTADPRLTASQPELKPWYLNFTQLNRYKGNLYYKGKMSKAEGYIQNSIVQQNMNQSLNDDFGIEAEPQESQYMEVEINDFSAEFDIPVEYSIPANNRPYIVDVAKYELPANFKHYSAPKMDRDAFLIAQITGWEDLNLVEGPANIYFSGTYTGRSYINTRNVKDTLDLSMGRDKKVLVTRSKVKDYSSTSFIGSTRTENLTYEMVVKNNRKSDIDITINDQVPVSQSDDIKVEVLDISSAQHNDLTGKLTWKIQLKPGESKKLKLSFNIKYPKNRTVNTKQVQKRSVRMF